MLKFAISGKAGIIIKYLKGKGVSEWVYACKQPSSIVFCLMCSPIYLLYRVIQDVVQKALFSEIQAIRSGRGNFV